MSNVCPGSAPDTRALPEPPAESRRLLELALPWLPLRNPVRKEITRYLQEGQ